MLDDENIQRTVRQELQAMGLDFYNRIKGFLARHVGQLEVKGQTLMGENLLTFYTTEWTEFKRSSRVLNSICGYLNRHWVKCEWEELRYDIYDVYQLALISWRDHFCLKIDQKVRSSFDDASVLTSIFMSYTGD